MPDVIFTGPEGRLEGRYHHVKNDHAPLALILHPHPQHGGTMNNKVVYTLYHMFARRGFSTLRFNFRGVGRSQGTFDRGEGELSDAAAALDWMQQHNPDAPYAWVAGFSFGSWIAMQLLMRRPEIAGFISVAPPANMYDFSFLAPCPSSGLMVVGSEDSLVSADSVEVLAKRLSQDKNISVDHHIVEAADHFFTGRRDLLVEVVDQYLDTMLASMPKIPDFSKPGSPPPLLEDKAAAEKAEKASKTAKASGGENDNLTGKRPQKNLETADNA